jgi:hypothetical protein
MTYFKMDDGFMRNTAMRKLGLAGRSLYLAGLCHCSRELTDGIIAKEVVDVLVAEAQVSAKIVVLLVAHGRWVDEGDHFRVHDYLEHQRSRAQVEAERVNGRKRVTAWRASRNGSGTAEVTPLLTAVVRTSESESESEGSLTGLAVTNETKKNRAST